MSTLSTNHLRVLGATLALLVGGAATSSVAAQDTLTAAQKRDSMAGLPTNRQSTAKESATKESAARQSAARRSKDSTERQSRDSTDHHFVHEASIGGLTEVRLGKMAQKKAQNQKVKDLGEKLATDHSKANDELAAAARKDGIHTAETKLDPKQKGEIDRLGGMSGKDFDAAYLRTMLRDHQETVQKFQEEANSGESEHVKQFASKTLPTLEKHLAMVQKLVGTLGVDTTVTNSTSSK